MKIKYCIISFLILISCTNSNSPDKEKYLKELQKWKEQRLQRLKSKNGWLNLAGLYWLNEGKNTLGSDSSNSIVFPPEAPPDAGKIIKSGDSIYFRASPDSEIKINGNLQNSALINPDASGNPDLMEYKSLAWYIIKRDSRYGIRLRDYDHPRILKLDHIPSFEPDLKWRKTAKFIPFDEPDTVLVPTVIGVDESYISPGKLVFMHEGKEYELLPFKAGKGFFIIIGDQTSAVETYPAGRFMYTELPDKDNEVILDFNKAYNPPCAFSPYATCPLPPPENRLDLRIDAGEKEVHLEMEVGKLCSCAVGIQYVNNSSLRSEFE